MKLFQIFLLLAAFLFTGCAMDAPALQSADTISLSAEENTWFTDRDLAGEYDPASAVSIVLAGDSAQVLGSGASAEGSVVTISEEGVYLLSGKLNDGQIIVDADKNDKVQLVLNGTQICSQTSAAVYVRKADKVFLTLEAGTENTLQNGGSYIAIDDNAIDSAIFSKADLTLNGSGSLTVLAGAGHGIVSKDALTIAGGTYRITAAEHGLVGKDSAAVASGSLTIAAGEDGIHVKNGDDSAKGNLYISGGDFVIESAGDGISATGTIGIDGGSFRITTGGGSKTAEMKAGDTMGNRFGRGMQTVRKEETVSAKGLKADGTVTVTDGTFLLDTADDAVHAGGDLRIAGGEWDISTGDDGIHSDKALTIQAGTFRIPYCYEGIEGQTVTIDGGDFDIVSADDGINAAGGMDGSGSAFMGSSSAIVINGGTVKIISDGDSLDSNGSITLNGGTLNLTCNGYGNTAVDCDGNYTNNGAEITTNDGSENGGGFAHGRGGRMNGFGSMSNDLQPPEGGFDNMPTRPEGSFGSNNMQRPEGSFGPNNNQRPDGNPNHGGDNLRGDLPGSW